MRIPDCYEADRMEEQRQRRWDERMGRLPKCSLCRKPILPDNEYHYTRTACVCADCMDELEDNVAISE